MKNFKKQKRIFNIVSQIPLGKVTTYKKLAFISDLGSPRIVGSILHQNNDPKNVPCHRVVHSDGSLAKTFAFGGESEQRKKLEEEGILFIGNKVSKEYLI